MSPTKNTIQIEVIATQSRDLLLSVKLPVQRPRHFLHGPSCHLTSRVERGRGVSPGREQPPNLALALDARALIDPGVRTR